MLVRTGITPRLFASRPDARAAAAARGRRGRTAHRGGRRGRRGGAGGPRGDRGVRPAGDARAVRGRVFRKRVYPAVYAIYTAPAPASVLAPPPRHQPASFAPPRAAVRATSTTPGRTGHCQCAVGRRRGTPTGPARGRTGGVIPRYNSGDLTIRGPGSNSVYRGTVRTPRGIRTVRYEA